MRALTESINRKGGGASAKKSAGAAESAEMPLFMEFSVGPMTAAFFSNEKSEVCEWHGRFGRQFVAFDGTNSVPTFSKAARAPTAVWLLWNHVDFSDARSSH